MVARTSFIVPLSELCYFLAHSTKALDGDRDFQNVFNSVFPLLIF